MLTKSKRLAHRYRLVILLFLCAMVGMMISWRQPSVDKSPLPPTQVIVKQAKLIDQGVQVVWLASRPGVHPINGYIIERKRDHSGFVFAGRVEKDSHSFIDSEGKAGDVYQVIAEDDRHPAGRSTASEAVIAAKPKPGSTVVISDSPPFVLGTSVALEPTTPGDKVTALQELTAHAFALLDTSLTRNDLTSARSNLNALQNYQREMLSLVPQLSLTQKKLLAQVCADRLGIFEANLHMLPEQDRLDGMLVLAGCTALREVAQ